MIYKDGKCIFSNQNERARFEDQQWRDYLQFNKKDFARIINYYRVYLTDQIVQHLKKKYKDEESKKTIIEYNIEKLPEALTYSFGKGHVTAFDWLATIPQKIRIEDFGNVWNKQKLITDYQRSLKDEHVVIDSLNNDINSRYLTYLDTITENMFGTYMRISEILFYKGFLQAVDDIQNFYQIKDKAIINSKFTHLPENRPVSITPAMQGTFVYGTKDFESWGLKWDLSYSTYDKQNNIYNIYDRTNIMLNIWKTTLNEIKNKSKKHIQSYAILNQAIKQKKLKMFENQGETPILVLEYMFLAAYDNENNRPHFITNEERLVLENAICERFADITNIDTSNTVIIYDN